MNRILDLRSDTITQPTEAMRAAIAAAVVGDDGFGDDPTVAALEARYASLTGKPAAVFVPSGVMANQIAMRILSRPGEVVVTGRQQHVVSFEYAAAARNSSVGFITLDDTHGVLSPEAVYDAIDAEKDHQPTVAAVSIENTHMFAGGVPYELSELDAVVAAAQGRPVHMDGARLFNAVVATGISAADYGRRVTTVMTCVSKGLGAPMGSLLAGPSDLIGSARIERKRLGGTMRQIGFMAAAGLVALDTMVDRLADDHARARRIAEVVASTYPESEYDPATCRTNIVAFNHPDARTIVARWRERGLLGDTVGPKRARLVTHKDLTDADVEATCHVIATSK